MRAPTKAGFHTSGHRRVRSSRVEALEPRQLFSSYTQVTVAKFSLGLYNNANGQLIKDRYGDLFFLADSVQPSAPQQKQAVFELARKSKTPVIVATFPAGDSEGGLVIDPAGNLFGTDQSNGTHGNGSVWEIAVGSHTVTTLASFDRATTGAAPNQAELLIDLEGDLFGTCMSGGVNSLGTVWELPASSTSINVVAPVTAEVSPFHDQVGGLTRDGHGNLFGTVDGSISTSADYGTVWEIPANTNTMNLVASLDGTHGSLPRSPLVVDSAGDIFGQALYGGAGHAAQSQNPLDGSGVIFEIPAGTSTVNVVAQFDTGNAHTPVNTLIMDSKGDFFGVSQSRAAQSGAGTIVFEVPKGAHAPIAIGTTSAGTLLCMDSSGNLLQAINGSIIALEPTSKKPTGIGLSVKIAGGLPKSVKAGGSTTFAPKLTVTNTSGATIDEAIIVSFYLSTTTAMTATSPQLNNSTQTIKLKTKAHTSFSDSVGLIRASLAKGKYRLIVRLTDPNNKTVDVFSSSLISVT